MSNAFVCHVQLSPGRAIRMTRDYAEVIGDPIAHSKSPTIHNFWLAKLDIDAEYRATHVTPDALAGHVAMRAADPAWRGANITLPHKVAILDLVADPGGVRASIGAANTLFRLGHEIAAANTDAAGFFAPLASIDLSGPVVVVGTGGAARAVLSELARAGTGMVTVIARAPLKALKLLAHFGLNGDTQALGARLPTASLLVNATSLGMSGQPPLDIDLSPMRDDAIIYDLVYAPLETPLLAAARARGLGTIDGLEMLISQAAMAFELLFRWPAPREHDAELRALLTK